ncbi:MAG TPA: hypothetical protein VI729_03105 [Anaerolineales bacterium]|nr:hypothetical protein [Anaerolineales bacterium]
MMTRWAAALVFGVAATACRSSLVEFGIPADSLTGTPNSATAAATEVRPPTLAAGVGFSYAVVWVEEGLAVRQPAGITSSEVASLPADQRGIGVTGQSTLLGSSTWLEIFLPEGGTGWVNGYNLTEDVAPEPFCQDPRLVDLANRFILALESESGDQLAQLASPKRGLIIRHDWWNPEVVTEMGSLSHLFQEAAGLDWGINRDSGLSITGSFGEVILPQLLDVFSAPPAFGCNRLATGSTAEEVAWPSEYTNLNFISFHRAAPSPNSLNWRTWALGIEYVAGSPYLAVLVQYRGEI